MAQPTDPKLWWEICDEHRAQTVEGAPAGKWSPRKAVLARLEYQRRGGSGMTTPPRPRRRSSSKREGSSGRRRSGRAGEGIFIRHNLADPDTPVPDKGHDAPGRLSRSKSNRGSLFSPVCCQRLEKGCRRYGTGSPPRCARRRLLGGVSRRSGAVWGRGSYRSSRCARRRVAPGSRRPAPLPARAPSVPARRGASSQAR